MLTAVKKDIWEDLFLIHLQLEEKERKEEREEKGERGGEIFGLL